MTVQRLTRAQWGALPPLRPLTSLPTARGVAVHYEGPRMGAYAHSRCIGIVRAIQRAHQANKAQGWKDIAYNELVCRHGVRFEGRGYDKLGGANGSSTANGTAYSICGLIGDGDPITPELEAGIADAAADYRKRGAGATVWGHRDFIATKCPGDTLYGRVKAGAFSKNPTTVPKEDTVTPQDIQKIAEAVATEMWMRPITLEDGTRLTAGQALQLSTRGVVESLDPDRYQQLVKDIGRELGAGFDVELTPKGDAQ